MSDGHNGDTHGEFSVCQFLKGDIQEYTRRYVSGEEAVKAFCHYCTNVAARVMKITERVIITDGGDHINMEWKQGEGIIFPENMKGMYK